MGLKVTCIVVLVVSTRIFGQSVPFSQSYRRSRLPVASPAYDKITKAIFPQPTAVPNYNYNYVVQDPYSGDRKSQQEYRSGDVVRGSYTIDDPDGTRRIVEYYADPVHGFNAIVRKESI